MFRACWTQPSRIIASSSSHSSLHTSAVLHGQSSRQHVARAVKKSNIARKEERWKKAQEIKPSVVLGTQHKWEKCRLAKVLVNEKDFVNEKYQDSSDEMVPTQQAVGTVYLPKQSNFGIGESEKQLLFGALPALTSTDGKDYAAVNDTGAETPGYVSAEKIAEGQKVWEANTARENRKANVFARVIDLRNANAAGIAYENRRRIIEAFSTPQNPFDPGRSEVQAALLTYKIRNLWNHLDTFKRDLGNRRGLRMLVHQRAKILKYLKKVDQRRYEIVLKQLALNPESVEGELVV